MNASYDLYYCSMRLTMQESFTNVAPSGVSSLQPNFLVSNEIFENTNKFIFPEPGEKFRMCIDILESKSELGVRVPNRNFLLNYGNC